MSGCRDGSLAEVYNINLEGTNDLFLIFDKALGSNNLFSEPRAQIINSMIK